MYCIQHCFICRPSDSTVSEDVYYRSQDWSEFCIDSPRLYNHSRILVSIMQHKVLIYHSVCPIVRIGTPRPPLPQGSVSPSPEPKGGIHSLAGEEVGGGDPNSDDRQKKKPSTLSTLSYTVFPSEGQPETTLQLLNNLCCIGKDSYLAKPPQEKDLGETVRWSWHNTD
jgi:hypothetical protein